jgi:hypothetical protein
MNAIHRICVVLLGVVTGAAAAPSSSADEAGSPCDREHSAPLFGEAGTSEQAVAAFLATLQKAVAADDRQQVASMMAYPIKAWAGTHDATFKTSRGLLASYERVFTGRLKETIAAARTECLFTNWQGVMVHDGELWFRTVEPNGLKIVKINGPRNPVP